MNNNITHIKMMRRIQPVFVATVTVVTTYASMQIYLNLLCHNMY